MCRNRGVTTIQPKEPKMLKKIIFPPPYSRYKKNMASASKTFLDLPESPLDKGVWWTEFVLRSDDHALSALRPFSVHQPWWKKRSLDIWATVFLFLLIVGIVLLKIVCKIFAIFSSISNSGAKNAKKLKEN